MGLFSKNNDQEFYDQRAAEVTTATDRGAIEAAADLVSHLFIEEGAQGLGRLAENINRSKK